MTVTFQSAQDRQWKLGLRQWTTPFGHIPPVRVKVRRNHIRDITLRGLEPRGGLTPRAKILHQNMVQTLRHKQKLEAERSSMSIERERPVPCLPLRSDHPCSSSVVEKPSDLENQIGRMYFRSDPVKYCTKQTKEIYQNQVDSTVPNSS